MKKYFLTFASSDLKKSLNRIEKQANDLNFFDGTFIYNENDLDEGFRKRFAAHLKLGSRGYAYWSWKPQVILQALEAIKEGDVILYTDVGCHLRKEGLKRLEEYFSLAEQHKLVTVSSKKLLWGSEEEKKISVPDYKWSKGDLLDYFAVKGDKGITHSETIGAGVILMKKTEWGINFIKEWLKVIEHDFRLIDDSPSRSPNLPGFIEHRHDQAIFSLLCKKYKVFSISVYEVYYPSKKDVFKPDWNKINDYPIWTKRDLGIKHKIKVKLKKLLKILSLVKN